MQIAFMVILLISHLIALIALNVSYFCPGVAKTFKDAIKRENAERSLNSLAQSILQVPRDLIESFLGAGVGLRNDPGTVGKEGDNPDWKIRGHYIAYLWLFYLTIGAFAVIAFPPVEKVNHEANTLIRATGFMAYIFVNVAGDVISLLVTKKYLGIILSEKKHVPRTALTYLFKDLLIATICLGMVQWITNGLYAIQIGRPELFYEYLATPQIMFRQYGPMAGSEHLVQFPGMIVMSATSFIPTFIAILLAMSIYVAGGAIGAAHSLVSHFFRGQAKFVSFPQVVMAQNLFLLANCGYLATTLACDKLRIVECLTLSSA
jgi:hypothetical protein